MAADELVARSQDHFDLEVVEIEGVVWRRRLSASQALTAPSASGTKGYCKYNCVREVESKSMKLLDRIISSPEIMVGKPVVKGTRIPVEAVLAHLSHTPDVHDLLEAYPRLTLEDVQACMAYAEEAVRKTYKKSRTGRPTFPAVT